MEALAHDRRPLVVHPITRIVTYSSSQVLYQAGMPMSIKDY
jgi:hypothetical protein